MLTGTIPNFLIIFNRSAFFWFTLDERPKFLKENPTISAIEEAKAMSRMWTAASPETKAKYEAIAEEDRARYDRVS